MTDEQELIIREVCLNVLDTPGLLELLADTLDISNEELANACAQYAKDAR